MSVLTLLLLGLLPLLEALRPEMAFATEVDEDTTRTEKGNPSRVVNVTMKPGPHGMEWEFASGRIHSVQHGSQADKLGLKAGQHIIRVGTKPFSGAAFGKALVGFTEFTLLVELPSSMAVKAEKVIICLAMPAVVLSCILPLVLPFLIYIHLSASSKWQVDMFSKQLSHPLLLIVLAAWACSKGGLAALEWPYRKSALIDNAWLGTDLLNVIGLLAGLHCNRNHHAFSKALDSASASLLWKAELVALTLCSLRVLIFLAAAKARLCSGHTSCQATDVMDARVILFLGANLLYLMLFALTCQMCRIGAATKQQMFEVQNGMPCLQSQFFECVHKPCAELLAELGAFLLAVSLLPLLLSSALKDFKTMLNQERQRDGTLHEQIEAVEAMMEKHNNGQGFGIPVFDGFVITKERLQMIGIRLALLGTAIKAFLDAELGYAKEPEEVLMPRLVDMQTNLVDMRNQLRNLTMLLRNNYTNHTKHL